MNRAVDALHEENVFKLGTKGENTTPSFEVAVTLSEEVVESGYIPPSALPKLVFEHTGTDGLVKVNSEPLKPNNKQPTDTVEVPNDTRQREALSDGDVAAVASIYPQ